MTYQMSDGREVTVEFAERRPGHETFTEALQLLTELDHGLGRGR